MIAEAQHVRSLAMIFSRLSSRRGLPQPMVRHLRNIASTSTRNTRAKPSDERKSPLVKIWDHLTATNWRKANPLPSMMYATACLLGYHVFTNYFYVIDDCHGQSMLPTFAYTGDLVCLSRYYRRGRGIQTGDLVSFKIPIKDEYGLKRVVGMPGDFVLMDTPGKSDAMIQVPEGHCWVAGDNLAHSRDSRHYGPIPLALIHGKAVFKYHYRRWLPTGFTKFDRGLKPAEIEDETD